MEKSILFFIKYFKAMRDKDAYLMMEAYSSKKLDEQLNSDFSSLGNDVDGIPVDQGHIVQLVNSPDPEKQYIVYGAAAAGPNDEAMVDIIELGKDISLPTQRLKVIGELGG